MLNKVRSIGQRLRGNGGLSSGGARKARVEVPEPPCFYSGPANANGYRELPSQVAGVPIRPPSGMVRGSWDYPTRFDRPSTAGGTRRTVAPNNWEWFREERLATEIKPWDFPAYLDNPSCRWLQALKALYARPITFPASISPEGGMLLHSIVRNERPKVMVETGTFLGASALWIAAALKENGGGVLHCFSDFVAVKPGAWRVEEMKGGVMEFVAERIAEAGLTEHVVLHPGNSAFELRASCEELIASGGVQIAYLDADHRPLGVSQDLWGVEPALQTGGLVILHDLYPSTCGDDGPRFLMDNVNGVATGTYQATDLFLSPINYGLGVMRRIG